MPRWTVMWILALGVIALCKGVLLRAHGPVASAWLWGWPGMDPERFHRRPARLPDAREVHAAWCRTALGGVMLRVVVPRLDGLVAAWTGLVALALLLHFGLLHLLSIHWRMRGYHARPLFDHVLSSRSLGDFWGNRWNRAFADFTRRFVLRPLAPRIGPRAALLIAFLASGLGHDLLLSVPAGGGYGRCTLYFLIQGAGVLIERRRRRRWFVYACVLAPLPLLFHPPFLRAVLLPFLEVIA